ncbi:MAG: undecaprenyl-phosphate glucose phosphotransferase [Betaproteobacteria bacterium]|nr:undecaprenyl-phosphate glucose phosphotransferase [Betaproteobacteria bacterium]MCC6248945.1 undecaprenyl-phosphate glucose phosphotransferase [Rubrivivax sp.]
MDLSRAPTTTARVDGQRGITPEGSARAPGTGPVSSNGATISEAPPPLLTLVAAALEPIVTVAVFLVLTLVLTGELRRPDVVLSVLLFALTFPGRNRFGKGGLAVAADIGRSWLFLMSVLLICEWATNSMQYFEPRVLLLWAVVTPLLQWQAVTLGSAAYRKSAQMPQSRRTAVIVGAGMPGVAAARALTAGRSSGTEIVGWFDDRGTERLHADAGGKLLGGLTDLVPYIRENGVKDVYITLPLSSQPRIRALLEGVQSTTASIFFVPDVSAVGIIQGRLRAVNGVPVVGICETPFTGINGLVKRISDIVLASVILTLISPLLLALAVGVKLSSPGPVIFRQRRNGLDGEEIWVYKFRSMTTQDNGPVVKQATRDDPRITPFGRFIRRTSLDELPQFFNVLQGRMSIVGPRPHAVAHNELYSQTIKAYMVRHKVRPGITGWAQVNGLRGETDTVEKMRARVELDIEYLRTWSLWLDLKIILRTIRVAFFDRSAY